LPSSPSVVTVTPASGVSSGSETTVRPKSVVVGAAIARDAGAACACAIPATVADAKMDILALATG